VRWGCGRRTPSIGEGAGRCESGAAAERKRGEKSAMGIGKCEASCRDSRLERLERVRDRPLMCLVLTIDGRSDGEEIEATWPNLLL
jgi:hypothetical protein